MADAAPEMPPEVNAEDWSTALYKALEHAQRTLQTKIEELHVQRSRLGAHDELIEVTQQNVMQEGAQLQAELKAKIGELRKVLDKYETDMVELVKRDEAWMLQSLNEQRGETKTYMDRTDTSLRTLRDDTSSVSTAHEVVERMERDVDSLTENLKRLPLSLPAFTEKPFPCKAEVLSDVVALDYPFTPWNMLVLSDSKDAYTDAEWVPQFVSGLLARLDPARAKELVRPFA
jgi:hypothetical protein